MSQSPNNVKGARAGMGRALRPLLIDGLVAMLLLAGSGVWATRFWNAWIAKGGDPEFYQSYFEPAVMVACGHGFVVAEQPRPAALDDFLSRRRDSFDCHDIPNDAKLGTKGLYQGAWIYLETTVGLAWRVLGISWRGMGPLFGLFFGTVIALAYAVFRLGMGRVLAVFCAIGLATSSTHLTNLPNLRDYAKAPFTLALILILGLLVTRRVTRVTVLVLAVAYGAVLGIGYGFRTDFLANLPVFAVVLFLFLDGGLTKQLALKSGATVLFLASFMVVSWPASSTVYKEGGCQWHVALLGLQTPFDAPLHITPAPHDFGYAYSDGYIDWTIVGYMHRVHPEKTSLPFCSHEYDVESGAYLRTIVTSFPADLIARSYGSVLQIAELPFQSWFSPLAGWLTNFYDARADFLRPRIGWGVYIGAAALLLAGAAGLRLGFCLLFLTAYFGGYPAIQFQGRHHFHLEFMTWWAFGFVVHQLAIVVWRISRGGDDWRLHVRQAGRSAVFAVTAAALIVGVLSAARLYQRRQASQLFTAYMGAPKIAIAPGGALPDLPANAWPQFLEVDVNERACGPKPAVTFRYNVTPVDGDLSRTFTVNRPASTPGITRVFLPVFSLFKQLEFSDDRPGCIVGAYRLADSRPFPLLVGLMLPPDWQTLPLHQRLMDWEHGPSVNK